MASTTRTPLASLEAAPRVRHPAWLRTARLARSLAGWATFVALVLLVLGALTLLAVRSVPAADCELYGSCSMAALMTYGAPA